MSDPPTYANAQQHLLNPGLVFNASTYRLHYQARDQAFAKAIVDFIASIVRSRGDNLLFEGNLGHTFASGEDKAILAWDHKIGYHAVEAFNLNRIPFIIEETKLDLRRRGFTVEHLYLLLENQVVKSTSQKNGSSGVGSCKCVCLWYRTVTSSGLMSRE